MKPVKLGLAMAIFLMSPVTLLLSQAEICDETPPSCGAQLPANGLCDYDSTDGCLDIVDSDSPVYRIPVKWVVLHDDGTGDVSDTRIEQQIDIFNRDFAGTSEDTDARIRFYTKQVVRIDSAEWYDRAKECYFVVAAEIYNTKAYGLKSDLEYIIYTCDIDNELLSDGGDTRPDGVFFDDADQCDGTIFDHALVGETTVAGWKWKKGGAMTHEAGHWLGLWHPSHNTIGDTCLSYGPPCEDTVCESSDDTVCDTPHQTVENKSCADTYCNGAPTLNFMSKLPDECGLGTKTFTNGQINRMRCIIDNFRTELPLEQNTVYLNDQCGAPYLGTVFVSTPSDPITMKWTVSDGEFEVPQGWTGHLLYEYPNEGYSETVFYTGADPTTIVVDSHEAYHFELRVDQPNGGETWPVGTTREIKTSLVPSSGCVPPDTYSYYVSRNNGQTWDLFATSPNPNKFWTVTMPASNDALVKVVASNSVETDQDQSDNVFTIGGGCRNCPPPIPAERSYETRLIGADPNPFNPSTTLRFELADAAPVTIDIFDVNGRSIRSAELTGLAAGVNRWTWHGRDNGGEAVGSGVYFVRLSAGPVTTQTIKVVLLK